MPAGTCLTTALGQRPFGRAHPRPEGTQDKITLGAISKAGLAGPSFRYSFARPLDEPPLWLPDYLAGAMGLLLHDGDERHAVELPGAETVEIPPLKP